MVSSSQRRLKKPRSSASALQTARDWTALPQDIVFTTFLKLWPREVTKGADRACSAWRRVAVGEPVLWRHLDSGTVALSRWRWWRAAVRRGAGRCESFAARCCNYASLQFLIQGAPSLKRLRLFDANITSSAELMEVIHKLASLEELELPEFRSCGYKKLIQRICEARPHLKRLSLTLHPSYKNCIFDTVKSVIPVMCELRSLELTTQYKSTVEEFMAIIDNCPLLESLHINCLGNTDIVKELREQWGAEDFTITSDLDEECVTPVEPLVEEQPAELGRGKRAHRPIDRLNL